MSSVLLICTPREREKREREEWVFFYKLCKYLVELLNTHTIITSNLIIKKSHICNEN